MSEERENYLKWPAILLTLALAYLGIRAYLSSHGKPESQSLPPVTQTPPAFFDSDFGINPVSQIQADNKVNTVDFDSNTVNGIMNVFTGMVYPISEDPQGFGRQCVSIPKTGTVWGATTVLGDPEKFSDVKRSNVIRGGKPAEAFWTADGLNGIPASAWLVAVGTVVCGSDN